MWYYCEKLNTLSNFDESDMIIYKYGCEDDDYGYLIGITQYLYHISDIKKISIKKLLFQNLISN